MKIFIFHDFHYD